MNCIALTDNGKNGRKREVKAKTCPVTPITPVEKERPGPSSRQPTFSHHRAPFSRTAIQSLLLFFSLNSSFEESQSKLPHRDGLRASLSLHELWEKVPGHAGPASTRKRAAIEAIFTAANRSLHLHPLSRSLSPLALLCPRILSSALGHALPYDDDMSR